MIIKVDKLEKLIKTALLKKFDEEEETLEPEIKL